jgi:hypothetical protein
MSNGHLGWANVRDDFDTVILVEEADSTNKDMSNIDQAIATGVPLKSRQVFRQHPT